MIKQGERVSWPSGATGTVEALVKDHQVQVYWGTADGKPVRSVVDANELMNGRFTTDVIAHAHDLGSLTCLVCHAAYGAHDRDTLACP